MFPLCSVKHKWSPNKKGQTNYSFHHPKFDSVEKDGTGNWKWGALLADSPGTNLLSGRFQPGKMLGLNSLFHG